MNELDYYKHLYYKLNFNYNVYLNIRYILPPYFLYVWNITLIYIFAYSLGWGSLGFDERLELPVGLRCILFIRSGIVEVQGFRLRCRKTRKLSRSCCFRFRALGWRILVSGRFRKFLGLRLCRGDSLLLLLVFGICCKNLRRFLIWSSVLMEFTVFSNIDYSILACLVPILVWCHAFVGILPDVYLSVHRILPAPSFAFCHSPMPSVLKLPGSAVRPVSSEFHQPPSPVMKVKPFDNSLPRYFSPATTCSLSLLIDWLQLKPSFLSSQ